jgi:hypothetical protein
MGRTGAFLVYVSIAFARVMPQQGGVIFAASGELVQLSLRRGLSLNIAAVIL